jgi:hypothetical protein
MLGTKVSSTGKKEEKERREQKTERVKQNQEKNSSQKF